MPEILFYQQSRDWFGCLTVSLSVLGVVVTFLSSDFFWMASSFALFTSWWLTVSESKNRMPQIILSIGIGMMIACIIDAISSTEPFPQQLFSNFVPMKVVLYTLTATVGVILGLRSYHQK
jgi:hypothetical protein